MKTIHDVKDFWETNPLWQGESQFKPGTDAYFEEHSQVYIEDCFAGELDPRTMPTKDHQGKVLDLGCGPGFWAVQLHNAGCREIVAADLTSNALQLVKQRCLHHKIDNAEFSQQNAESMTFEDATFDHVNCQGVIHHTPDTPATVAEIARVLKAGGTASVSVYYKNWFLRNWSWISWIGKVFSTVGAKLKGRGRESIFAQDEVNEIVRLYDGAENPIGKAYSEAEFNELLSPHFEVKEFYLHFFPARTLPFPMPGFIHRYLDKNFGFLIYATVVKK